MSHECYVKRTNGHWHTSKDLTVWAVIPRNIKKAESAMRYAMAFHRVSSCAIVDEEAVITKPLTTVHTASI